MTTPAASSVARIASAAPVRLDALELRLVRLPLREPFEVSFGRIESRLLFLIRLEAEGVSLCRPRAVPLWCGGMLESGIGRAHNVALASLPGFTLPGDISASRRYFARDIIAPEVEVAADGTIAVPPGAGLGFEADVPFLERHSEAVERLARHRRP